ncbi:MAG: hypothetical protein A2Y80_08080 [Deltaproteobacteria bacterium RBG_13_58_19]|nr:MAG: hypothetical protein A2Y80_08080 [Deltaproteobacteria bacterium RBG_13_58_19]
MAEALAVLLERCPFPGILGRICSHPCETACTRNRVDEPIAIAPLKRYLADLYSGKFFRLAPGPSQKEKVAIVGGGPAGLMAAYELRLRGYPVTIFEAEEALGGALRLYIPPYRLSRAVLEREVGLVEKLGAEVRLGLRLGRDVELAELRREYDAVFLALGAQQSLPLNVPGEDLAGVLDALSFLKTANAGAPLKIGPKTVVIGGGNAALDVARTARRLGAGQVTVVCLEAPEEMPAFPGEVAEAKKEGCEILHRLGVKSITGKEGRVTGLALMAVEQVFDEQGRFAPTFAEDLLTIIEADMVITAVGQTPDLGFLGPENDLAPGAGQRLEVDPQTLATAIPGVFAGGDLVTGPRTAVEAFAAGRRAAIAIDSYLRGQPLLEPLPPLASRPTDLIVDLTGVAQAKREHPPSLPYAERLAHPQTEVEFVLDRAGAEKEAGRCLTCVCSQCVTNCTFLQAYVEQYPYTEKELVRLLQERGESAPLIPYSCHFCGLCQAVCPKDLHAGEACLDWRRRLVNLGKGPLPQHQGIRNYVKWGTSPYFALALPDPATGKAERVFFPGCSLPGYSPHLVKAAYGYLRQRLPHTGIMLNCCGAPSDLTGEAPVLERVLDQVVEEMAKLGATELIAACTHCLHTIKEHRPEIKTRSFYEVMLDLGLPDFPQGAKGQRFHLQDACGARGAPEIHAAVRHLLQGMGHRLEEMPHSRERSVCCGAGGMVPAVDPELAGKMTAFCLSEAKHDLVTYCATCQATLVRAGHPSLHLLELMFNPAWPKVKSASPAGSLRRWWRRWRLKRYFQGLAR